MRRWHLAALTLSVTAALGAGAAWRAVEVREALYGRVERRLEGNAASIETAVERWIEERRYDAATVAGEVAATMSAPQEGAARHVSSQALSLLLQRMLSGHGYQNVWVLDADGRLIDGAAPGAPDAAEIAAARETARDGQAKLCEPFTDARGRMALCYAASPIAAGGASVGLAEAGPVPFVVVLRSDPAASLIPLLESAAAVGGTERGRLIDRTSRGLVVLGSSRRTEAGHDRALLPWSATPSVLQRAIGGQVAHGRYRDFDGGEVIAGARHIRGTDWAVVRQVDREEIDLVYRSQLRTEGFGFVALLAAIGLGIAAVVRSERSRRVRDVAASEARLADTLRSSLDPVIAFDEGQRITFFNAAAERTYRRRADDVLGEPVTTLMVRAERDRQSAAIRAFVRSSEPSVLFSSTDVAWSVRADGEVFPVEGALTKGEATGQRIFTLIVRDVTERQRHQQERELSLSLLRATLESTADAILVVDPNGHTAAFNRKFIDLWGFPEAITATGDDGALLAFARERLRDPQGFSDRVSHLYAEPLAESYDLLEFVDGRTVERVSRPQRLGDRVVGRVWSFRDVTARELAAAALRRSEASARAFVERSPYGICRVTPDGLFMSANPALVAMLGYPSEDELLRVDVGALYMEPADRQSLMRRHESGEDSAACETRWRRADGAELPIRISSQMVRDARGNSLHFLAYVENLAPLRTAEQALRQAEKLAAVGQFVSGVAHELNNPLAAILLFAENLMEEGTPGQEHETLSMLREQAFRARAIVRDLLSFVRGTHGNAATHAAAEIITHTLRSLEPQAAATGARLEPVLDDELGWIHADRGAIEQVITNLVVNALQAAPGQVVRVRAAAIAAPGEAPFLRVVVEDEGPGIEQDALSRVFEPFFTTKAVGVGTGLGLSVSLGIVERHGGTLSAENRPAGEGTGARLTLTLPLVAAPTTPHALGAPGASVASSTAPARRVLVVDDEAAIRRALSRFFARRQWQVDEASDGGEALDRLLASVAGHEADYDLVISDLRMPGVSGVVLHDRLAEQYPEILDRLVFSTGDVVSPDAAAFVARTGCAVIEKPFQFAALDELVSHVTARRTSHRRA